MQINFNTLTFSSIHKTMSQAKFKKFVGGAAAISDSDNNNTLKVKPAEQMKE